jgi:hypothetical protein
MSQDGEGEKTVDDAAAPGSETQPATSACPDGSETCACYGNLTCNAGLVCLSHLCVSLGLGSVAPGGAEPVPPAMGQPVGAPDAAVSAAVPASTEMVLTAAGPALAVPSVSSSSGAVGGVCGAGCTDSASLDDFEDGDLVACPRAGWDTGWWLATDGLGTLTAPLDGTRQGLPSGLMPSRGTSCHGLHVAGAGFSSWGVNVGLTFNNPDDTVPRPVSLAGATGISFWLRGSGKLHLLISTSDTDPPENGGTCSGSCKQYFTESSYAAIPSEWTKRTILFSSLYSGTVGRYMSASDVQKVLFIAFASETSSAFDLWLDDIALSP